MLPRLFAATAALAAAGAVAQLVPPSPDWREQDAPPPPALQAQQLVPVEVASGPSDLRFGVDPTSISIGADGVVRYVFVASSPSGALNASYLGLRCDKGEYRVYARSSGEGWRKVQADWRSVFEGAEARRALAVARNGACQGRTPNESPQKIARDLAAPPGQKFNEWTTR